MTFIALSAALLLPTLSLGDVSAVGTDAEPGIPAPAQETDALTWNIDTTHSELTFRIRHLVSRVRGTFREWEGVIVADPANLQEGTVNVTIQTASIFTNNEQRDEHLRSADFFDAANHPTITFRSRRVEVEGDALRVIGDLTIRGNTREVVLAGETLGVDDAGNGQRVVGFEVGTRINRLDYGVRWNRGAEGGGVILGDDVDIAIVVAARTPRTGN